MSKTVVGSFDTFEHARDVVTALEDMGVPQGDLNVVANDAAGRLAAGRGAALDADRTDGAQPERDPSQGGATGADTAASAGRGAVAGGVIGGTAGLIAGLAGLAVPGVGPLVAAGPIAATLAGAGIGAVAGGLIGGLRAVGVSDTDAEYYAEAVRRGGALVVVKAEDGRATAIADAMRLHGAIDIESRVAAWRATGWSGFDASAPPYTREEIERERERLAYRTGAGTPRAIDRGEDADLRGGGLRATPTAGAVAGTTAGAGALGGAGMGTARGTEHPNLGRGPDRPGVDPRDPEHGRRAGMAAGDDDGPPGSPRGTARRVGDAVERPIPGDPDGDGR